MANCRYCLQPAGLLKKFHKECLEKYEGTKSKIELLIKDFIKGDSNNLLGKFKEDLTVLATNNFINNTELNNLIVGGWEKSVEGAFEDGILSNEEENHLIEVATYFGMQDENLNKNDYYQKLIKGALLRELMEGKIPERIKIDGDLPFNFQKNEKVVWLFQNVELLENRTRRQYVGAYQGVSVRITKGIYYRTGGFKGNPVNTVETIHTDTGLLATTDKHIYFQGAIKGFKIPYNKIVSYTPYSNGIGVQKDGVSAKPQSFITNDGWFIYNLITNLSSLQNN
jgi:hypothetical protein